jgi:hypothetical protein
VIVSVDQRAKRYLGARALIAVDADENLQRLLGCFSRIVIEAVDVLLSMADSKALSAL